MKKLTLFSFVFILLLILLGFNTNSASAYDEGLGGCSSAGPYNTQTGQLCVNPTAVVGCLDGYLFSPVTGQSCSGTSTSQDNSSSISQFNSLFKQDFKIGTRGDAVKSFQQFLKDEGYYFGKIDGKYGKITARAVKDFQDDNGVNLTENRDGIEAEFKNTPTLTPIPPPPPPQPTSQSPVISGVGGPQSLNVNQQGTWTVTAYDAKGGSGNLSYSVVWGDEAYKMYSSSNVGAALGSQVATFTHTYSQARNYTPVFTVTNSNGQDAKTSLSVKVGETIKPDIIISNVTCVPTNPKTSDSIICDVIVYNNSSVNITKSFDVNIQGTAVTVNAPLNAWEKRTISNPIGFGLSIVGSNTLNFPADIWNSIDESNENNNMFTMTINVNAVSTQPLSITTPSLLIGAKVGIAYENYLGASGGTGSYSWTVTSGSLPVSFGSPDCHGNNCFSAKLYGTPTDPGTWTFNVSVTSGSQTATKQFTMTVNSADPIISYINPSNSVRIGLDIVNVYGSNFKFPADIFIDGGTYGATGNVISSTQMSFIIPNGTGISPGMHTIQVVNVGNKPDILSNALNIHVIFP